MMRKAFAGYYTPTGEGLKELWDKSHFVFDTNILLKLIKYPKKEYRDLMFSIMEKLKDRIWIPHQVALEYHRNLEGIIFDLEKEYKAIESDFLKAIENLSSRIDALGHTNQNTSRVIELLKENLEAITNELSLQKSDLFAIRDRTIELIGQNFGEEFSQVELDKIYTEGEKRYRLKTPPGFADEKEKKEVTYSHNGHEYQAKYGDLIFWNQILNYAKQESVTSMILVSEDNKPDWVHVVRGEKKGTHPELIHEFMRETNGKSFYSYNSYQFFDKSKSLLNIDDTSADELIKELESIHQLEYDNSSLLANGDLENWFEQWKDWNNNDMPISYSIKLGEHEQLGLLHFKITVKGSLQNLDLEILRLLLEEVFKDITGDAGLRVFMHLPSEQPLTFVVRTPLYLSRMSGFIEKINSRIRLIVPDENIFVVNIEDTLYNQGF
ncbi:PIN domain-containing protein [Paenibacillus sp. 7516]|uniref:PIN domain-containing protein n=1 Tax=Paenibacillus sp. 7516 TaxID=2022549 RepID=UPI000BA60337|nr:PIN domain-containing protein [Paenibacillus sp. 7516]PAF31875.1 hypothetical protein CHI14_09490 [Paenibacillus sp. 7516]